MEEVGQMTSLEEVEVVLTTDLEEGFLLGSQELKLILLMTEQGYLSEVEKEEEQRAGLEEQKWERCWDELGLELELELKLEMGGWEKDR